MTLLFQIQIHHKMRQAAERIRIMDTDPDVEVVEVW
jgi:hypothetical protein